MLDLILLIVLTVPFLSGLGVTLLLLRAFGPRGALWSAVTGVGIAAGFLVLAASLGWLHGSPDRGSSYCGDSGCWDFGSPLEWVALGIGASFVLWLLGLGVAAAIAAVVAARRHRRSVDA